METLLADLRHAVRMLRQSPGFTITAVSALALGIGANTAIFSVVNTVLLKPLPYPQPDRVVQLMLHTPQGNAAIASVPIYNVWRAQDRVLEDITAYDLGGPGLNLTGGDRPEQVKGIRVSHEYFRLFGVPMAQGRAFMADEDFPRGPRVAALSFGLWQRRFGANPDLVGKPILLGGEPYTVVGIIGPDFAPDPAVDIWLPFQADPNSTNNAFYFRAAGRLKPGVTLEQAKAALDLAALEFKRKFPDELGPKATFTVEPLADTMVRNIRPTLFILLGAVGFVLLIACANVANLLLARAGARAREMAIRAAIGAGRARIIRQLLTESVLLAAIGGVFGLIIGVIGVRALLAVNPGNIPRIGVDGAAVTIDWRILGFTLLLALLTGILFGVVPALHASRPDLSSTLKEGGSRSGGRQNRVRSVLVIVEMALAIVLLVGAGLLIRSFMALHNVTPGFDPHHVLTFSTSLTGSHFDRTAAIDTMARQAEERIEAIPGVQAAAVAATLPLQGGLGLPFTIEGRPLTGGPYHGGGDWTYISYRYFDVFRIPVLRGRVFNIRDDGAAPLVVVISDAMARKFWPKENPVGQRISIAKGPNPVFNEPPREIIGVVADVHDDGLNVDPGPKMYVPLGQVKDGVMAMNNRFMPLSWAVRTNGDPYLLSAAIQRELQTAADLPAADIRSMEQVVIRSTSRNRFNTLLLGVFAFCAILLACIGLYGLMSYSVEQRTLEFGIRLALGAESGSLRSMVMRHAMKLAVAGIVIGIAGAYGLTRMMAGLLFGVKPTDPGVFSGVAILLLIVALLASYLPAQRAVRIDPMVALRYE